ncbi:hypothetical protein BH11MYX2_BH11MYX2_28330 [soil metagenome]
MTIDGQARGRVQSSTVPLTLRMPAGTYEVECKQGTLEGSSWKKPVTVLGGETATLIGSVQQMIDVRLDVDATISGTKYKAGQVVRLARGRYDVQVSGANGYVSISVACHLGADLQCRR